MTLTAGGIGSGLPINDMITQLMELEARPLHNLDRREASYQASLSAFGQVKGVLSSFQSATDALKDAAIFSGTRTSVGDGAGFTASSDTTASAGDYRIQVQQLAQFQRVATNADGFAPGEGEGSLTITFGTYQGGENPSFVADAERQATLEFEGGSLEELRDAINGDATLGIKASIIFNGDENQLVLHGTGDGADRAFQLEGTGSLAGLSYNPADDTPDGTVYSLQQAHDARLTVDGIEVTRGSNSIDDIIDGVTLNLTRTTDAAASLSVATTNGSARSAIEGFVAAYNEVHGALRELTQYDAEAQRAAVLTGDSTVRGIQTQLRSMLGGVFAGGGDVSMLSELGLRFQRDGTLAIDDAVLTTALNDPDTDVAGFFADGEGGVKGVASQISDRLDNYLRSGGLIDGRTDGISSSIDGLDRQRETLLRRLDTVETRYRAQFTALDSMIASMNQTSSYLAQQLANLPQPNSIGRNN